ncbi:MAG: Fe-S cluster assembly protein SufD [Ideonella sp.]
MDRQRSEGDVAGHGGVDVIADVADANRPLAELQPEPAKPPVAQALASLPEPSWMKALRVEADERVGQLAMPTTRDESWRFTDIAPLLQLSLQPQRTSCCLQAGDIDAYLIDEATTRLVFVDGIHVPRLSSVDTARAGIEVGNLNSVAAQQGATIQKHLGRHAAFHDKPFAALNTASLHDAAVILIARGTAVATPVHLLFIATQPGITSHPRALLVAEPASAVTLIEDYVALHDGAYFTNSVVEIVLGACAAVEHVRVQRESSQALHVASCAVSLAQAGRYHSVNVALGARISRLELDVRQTAEATECSLDGLALIDERQLADTHTLIDHAQPHGVSRQLHKTIVGGAAHAVFSGKVMVRPGAQQTDSAQSSRNLLLSAKAQVDTLPQLEIFADDVKCTHGAAVGQLDNEEIFYLRSRGLSEVAARSLLTHAFGAEIIDRIPVASLRRRLEQSVLERTSKGPP